MRRLSAAALFQPVGVSRRGSDRSLLCDLLGGPSTLALVQLFHAVVQPGANPDRSPSRNRRHRSSHMAHSLAALALENRVVAEHFQWDWSGQESKAAHAVPEWRSVRLSKRIPAGLPSPGSETLVHMAGWRCGGTYGLDGAPGSARPGTCHSGDSRSARGRLEEGGMENSCGAKMATIPTSSLDRRQVEQAGTRARRAHGTIAAEGSGERGLEFG